jgi:enoyl-[acyl-carrier protein] reductase II
MERRLSKHWNKGREFLGVRYPLLCGAMTWISDSRLVRTVGEAGAFGVLAAGNMPVENLEAEVKAVQAADPAIPFAVNLITIAPNYLAHLKKLADMGVPYIVFAGSFPKKGDVQMAKASGARVMCFASTGSIAARMIDYGTDALILEGSEAGGHIGHVSTVVLIQEVLFRFGQVPVFVAGGVATGRMIAHLLLMGAAGVQMGTVFAMSEECRAHPAFKERFRRARSREAMATPEYDSSLPIVSVRAIKNKGTEDFGKLQLDLLRKIKDGEIGRVEAQYQVEKYWIGALRRAVEDGDVDHGSLMAGQCVGLIDEVKPVRVIIEELVREAEETLAMLGQG